MILPAIDLLNGQSVRLRQGDYQQVTPIHADPVRQAQAVNTAGIHALHVVDLEGARTGRVVNLAVIQKIRTVFEGFMAVGGGIRTLAQITQYAEMGVNRIILGSIALKSPELVKAAVGRFGDVIAVSIDGKNNVVATEGWLEDTNVSFDALMAEMLAIGVKQFIVTDVARDGMLTGPNIPLLMRLQQQFPEATIIASGGIAELSDVLALQQAGITDVIIGKALAVGQITLAQLAASEV
ncbi:1-(5-phosphoribosyl)-5-[(5-phosphoribosylamino)methylideneamino]imidazole-4-carboxamide isomerase [Leuconostoc lactis]|uniref:1-(5-phosphoribosyl)-5-[(5- phosphoribosylamino)methylideneamino]imidazole-4- carboxamide isomerase n=1 Tax=Leuconostoc lactis TaxID=1246 RepID=UPI000814C057|nr:1-(5-phosphoribosyl)-5-[(5-phosphoribosylamino)methylideneamino]imidazole-4-carboxamide isomerase [Leuconostoc lactis]ANY11974.1 1-(5-phosphoribosyl)-5-[(5-phosphoribosylamino)methylideneamino]imidazole-4-carboxamide isomerase [Leuconostoc lactis]